MKNLPNEFYEWLKKLKNQDGRNAIRSGTMFAVVNGFENLPKPCQHALIVQWLEQEKKQLILVFPVDDWDEWYYQILAPDAMAPFFTWVESFKDDLFFESRESATESAILKALELC